MNHFLFVLGQNHSLSTAEIQAVFPSATIELLSPGYLNVSLSSQIDCLKYCPRLGGTIKVAQFLEPFSGANQIVQNLKKLKNKNFSISHLGGQDSFELSHLVKEKLSLDGLHPRFISAKGGTLSPLIIAKQHVTEFIIINDDLYQTIWVHSFKHWIERDRKKPYIDPKGGMLPPKLARIMVNLALGDKNDATLLDPFCGTGTILMEAQILGLNVIGSDQDPGQVQGAQANLAWLPKDHYLSKEGTSHFYTTDATKLSTQLTQKVDLVVTEPYLGPSRFTPGRIPNIVKGLQKLYLGALKDFSKFLPSGAKLVIAFPQFQFQGRTISTSDFIDRRENLGYNLLVKDLIFTRPGAQITRQIVILEKL